MEYEKLKSLNWGTICANYDRRKRRNLVVEAMRAVLTHREYYIFGTKALALYIVREGENSNLDATMEAVKIVGYDLTGMAPFCQEAKQGEPERFGGKTIRPWSWCLDEW